MFAQQEQSFEAWMKPSQDVFNYWISFFPTAPLFGVEYRFGEILGQGAGAFTAPTPPEEVKPAPEPEVVPVAYDRVSPTPAPSIEPDVAAVEAPAPAEPVVETVAEEVPVIEAAAEEVVEAEVALAKPKGLLAKAPADADDLKLIKGVGPGLEKQLNGLGIYRFKQMAKFKTADLEWVDDNLSSFKGRCFRDDWVGQAKALMA